MEIDLYIAYSARCCSLMKIQTLLQHSNVFGKNFYLDSLLGDNNNSYIFQFQNHYHIYLSHSIFRTCLIDVKQKT